MAERKTSKCFQLKRRPGKIYENICIFYNKQCTYNPQKSIHLGKPVCSKSKGTHSSIYAGTTKYITEYIDDGTRHPTQILKIRREKNGEAVHPTQKPVALMEYLIKTYSLENELILDFTCGSGSTLVACQNTGRNFIGIEKELKYYNICIGRLEKK